MVDRDSEPGMINLHSPICPTCAAIHRPGDPCRDSKPTNPKDLVGIKKVRLSLVPMASLVYEAAAMQDGASKYGPFNWREKGVRASIYVDAALRHILGWFDGEELAQDSKIHHLAHAKACLGILVDSMEQGNFVDDRPSAGAGPRLLDEFKKP